MAPVEVLALLRRHRGRAFCEACIAFLLDADVDEVRAQAEELDRAGLVSRTTGRCAGCGGKQALLTSLPQ